MLSYTRDVLGRISETACTIGGVSDYVTDYSYDALGRVTSIRQSGNTVAEKRIDFTYDGVGQYDEIRYYNDTDGGTAHLVMTATYSYDDCGNLTGLVYTNASNATLRGFAWTYDALGQVSSQNSDLDAEDVSAYTYDATGQLVSVDYTDASKTDESYAYDETGNRTEANADTYTTGDANQTTSDGTYSYTYDENGNLTAKYVDEDSDGVIDAGDSDVTEYTWDVRNRLVEASHRSLFNGDLDWTAQYDYDIFNHRIASRYDDDGDGIADRVERYVWDGDQIVLEFVDSDGGNNSLNSGTESAAPALAERYVWGQAVDQLLAQETVSNGSPADVSYIVRDNLGSTRSLVNHLGDVTATYSYDSYGNVTATVGSLTATRFLYTCQEYDTRLGLYYYNARWYSPTLGRFISEDPMGFAAGDTNLYRYVGNSPTNYIDPLGLCKDGKASKQDSQGKQGHSKSTKTQTAPPVRTWKLRNGQTVRGRYRGIDKNGRVIVEVDGKLQYYSTEELSSKDKKYAKLQHAKQLAILSKAAYGKSKKEVQAILKEAGLDSEWEVVQTVGTTNVTAWAFRNKASGKYVIAFPGTVLSDKNTHEANVAQGSGQIGAMYTDAMKVVWGFMHDKGLGSDDLELTGHSLGGGLASAAAIANNLHATVFNPAGLHQATITSALDYLAVNYGIRKTAADFITWVQVYAIDTEILTQSQDKGLIGKGMPDTFGTMNPIKGLRPYDKTIGRRPAAHLPIVRIIGTFPSAMNHKIASVIDAIDAVIEKLEASREAQ